MVEPLNSTRLFGALDVPAAETDTKLARLPSCEMVVSVPLVGRLRLVAPDSLSVNAYPPAVLNAPEVEIGPDNVMVLALELATPVPPFAGNQGNELVDSNVPDVGNVRFVAPVAVNVTG